jgi:hypothetical protein
MVIVTGVCVCRVVKHAGIERKIKGKAVHIPCGKINKREIHRQ